MSIGGVHCSRDRVECKGLTTLANTLEARLQCSGDAATQRGVWVGFVAVDGVAEKEVKPAGGTCVVVDRR